MNILLSLFPTLISFIGGIIGRGVSATEHMGIWSGLLALGSNITSDGVMGVIKGVLGNIEDAQLLEIKAHVETLLKQAEIYEQAPESFLYKGWRPTLAWILTGVIAFHLSFCELLNILSAFHIYTPGSIAPLNTITVTLMFGLLGIYMGARTVEKVNSNQDT